MVGMESAPYTQNLHYFSLYRDKYLGRYKAERQVRELVLSYSPYSY